jgi:UDP-N-acetylmuramoyl-tripeptide--D-alanyl-D-alanine ligase
VYRNPGNLNNHIGVPLTLIELRGRPDVAVVELGMNHAGEISRLVELAEPDVRVWLNVGDAHLGHFASVEAIADAKAEILERASGDTLAVLNADDPRVMARAAGFAGRVATFGTSPAASVRAVDVRDRGVSGTDARVVTPHGEADVRVPLPGRGPLFNVLAATAVALAYDVPLSTIVERAARLAAVPRRGEVVRLGRGVVLVDDSYNSSPAALAHALDALATEPAARRVAVLGEMRELGEFSTALHEQSGRAAAAAGVALLIAVGGPPARALADAAVAAGMPADQVHCFASSVEAAPAVSGLLRAGDVVLVKGSRGTGTDVVADRVKAEWA